MYLWREKNQSSGVPGQGGTGADGPPGADHEDLSGELPTGRADLEVVRERTHLRLKGTAGIFSGEMEFTHRGTGRSVAGVATGLIGIAGAACIGAAVAGVICASLAHAAPAVVVVASLGVFAVVLFPGLVLSLRRPAA
ncbi:MAG TPA: hypothetical protein VGG75_14730 [Trebonia sp.]|jgi:hypothetical protein